MCGFLKLLKSYMFPSIVEGLDGKEALDLISSAPLPLLNVLGKASNDVNNNQTLRKDVSAAQFCVVNVLDADEDSVTSLQADEKNEDYVAFLDSEERNKTPGVNVNEEEMQHEDSITLLDSDVLDRAPGVNVNPSEPVVEDIQRGTVFHQILAFKENNLLDVSPVPRLKLGK